MEPLNCCTKINEFLLARFAELSVVRTANLSQSWKKKKKESSGKERDPATHATISPSIDVRLQRRRMLSIYLSLPRAESQPASQSPDAPGQRRDGDRHHRGSPATFQGLVTVSACHGTSGPLLSSHVSSIGRAQTNTRWRSLHVNGCYPSRPAVSPRSTPSRKSLYQGGTVWMLPLCSCAAGALGPAIAAFRLT